MGNLKIISVSKIRSIISKGPGYGLPSPIYFSKCWEEIAVDLNELCKRWCKRIFVNFNALNTRVVQEVMISHAPCLVGDYSIGFFPV